ncbi:hypothetical protein Hanom_Chr04g00300631 [Helianthus anomalus]
MGRSTMYKKSHSVIQRNQMHALITRSANEPNKHEQDLVRVRLLKEIYVFTNCS